MQLLPRLGILFCAFLGASTIVIAEPLIKVVPPLFLLGTRFLLAALLLAAVFPRRVFPVSHASVKAGLLTGAGFGIGCLMLYLSLPHVRAGKLTFLIALEVLIVPLLCLLIYRQPVSRAERIALFPALAGLWLITGNSEIAISWWECVVLLSAFAYAVYTISLSHVDPAATLFSRTFVSFLLIGLCALICSFPLENHSGIRWESAPMIALIYLVVLGSFVRFLLQSWSQRYVSASFAALTFTAEPVFAFAMSYFFLGERFSSAQTAGAILILLGLLLSNLPIFRVSRI